MTGNEPRLFDHKFTPMARHVAYLVSVLMRPVATLYDPHDWDPWSWGINRILNPTVKSTIDRALTGKQVDFVKIYGAVDPANPKRQILAAIGRKDDQDFGLEVENNHRGELRSLLRSLAISRMTPWSYRSQDGRMSVFLAVLCLIGCGIATYLAIVLPVPGSHEVLGSVAVAFVALAVVALLLPKRIWTTRSLQIEKNLSLLST